MKLSLTIEFDSKEEYDNTKIISGSDLTMSLNKEILDKLNSISDKVEATYHSGDDDVGGKNHKDHKQIEDVAEDYDENRYSEALELFMLIADNGREDLAGEAVKGVVGDYVVNEGLSDKAYDMIIRKLTLLCENLELWEFMTIAEKYE